MNLRNKNKALSVLLLASALAPLTNAQVLIDAWHVNAGNPSGVSQWTDAGVGSTINLSNSVAGTVSLDKITSAGLGPYGISNLSFSISSSPSAVATFKGNNYGSAMMDSYFFTNNSTATVTLSNWANTLTGVTADGGTVVPGTLGNTFTLQPSSPYRLWLFGSGDSNGQNTTFTFNGVAKTTSDQITGTSVGVGHYVTYDFVTGANLANFNLSFNFTGSSSSYGAWNGLALVAIPEASTFSLVAGGLALAGVLVRRRRTSKQA
jgi:hypothetical protein